MLGGVTPTPISCNGDEIFSVGEKYHIMKNCYSVKLQALIYPPHGYLFEDILPLEVRNSPSDAK